MRAGGGFKAEESSERIYSSIVPPRVFLLE